MSHIVMIHQSYGIIRVQPPPSWCSSAAATIVRLTGAHRVLIGPRARVQPTTDTSWTLSICADKQSSHCEDGGDWSWQLTRLPLYVTSNQLSTEDLYGSTKAQKGN